MCSLTYARLAVRGYMNPELRETDVKRLVTREWRKERDARETEKVRKRAEKENRPVRQAELNAATRKPLTEAEKKRRDDKIEAALIEFRAAFGTRPASALEERALNISAPSKKKVYARGSADRNLMQENVISPDSADRDIQMTSRRRTRSSL
ncbi:hypothetical protein NMY22_g14293 [Coprinellus aureogranulatus]|nr:hypothetical protein NMY22_g14293 [Coprinellus aureogranulatus]